jgi:FkbM family methyltransferase
MPVKLKRFFLIPIFVLRRQHFWLPKSVAPGQSKIINLMVDFSFKRIIQHYKISSKSLLVVGANDGSDLVGLNHFFNSILVIEPLRNLNAQLRFNLKNFNKFEIYNVGVSDTLGELNINLASNLGQSSSFLTPKRHLEISPEVQFTQGPQINMVRLDNIISQNECPDIWLMDVQGYELFALKGAGDLLHKVLILYIEISNAEIYEGCAKVTDLDEYLKIYGFTRVLTRWWGAWGDAVYTKKALNSK